MAAEATSKQKPSHVADDAPQADSAMESVAVPDVDSDEDVKSQRVTLADLSAKGTALYAHKKYEEASELFSRASVLQASINGETAPENAAILFHYGRSLFKVGQGKSDVLGGPAVADKKTATGGDESAILPASLFEHLDLEKIKSGASAAAAAAGARKAGGAKDDAPKDKAAKNAQDTGISDAKKPLFQFTGDENFDASDDEGDEGDEPEEQEEENDDLATAFEVLDLARVCYLKQLAQPDHEDTPGKGKEVAQEDSPAVRHIKERLADTHDCLAEISLENERSVGNLARGRTLLMILDSYPNAIEDGRVSLRYKMELYPEDSEIVAEAHYKLSLALEFASITMSSDEGPNTKREVMDQGLRDEAIKEMELAIKSFRLKMQNKEVELATMASPEDNDVVRKSIADMKEVIAEMEQRLVDLREDPIDKSTILDAENPKRTLESVINATDKQALIDEAVKTANDVSSLVRKKTRPAPAHSKRKADAATDGDSSRARGASSPAPLPDDDDSSSKKPRLADEAAE